LSIKEVVGVISQRSGGHVFIQEAVHGSFKDPLDQVLLEWWMAWEWVEAPLAK
jgi:hypothetical protein